MNIRIVAMMVSLAWASTAVAQTIETDRPDQTEAATLVPVGGVQLETGVAGWTQSDGLTTGYTLPTALLRYGLHERFELRLIGQRDQWQSNIMDMVDPWMVDWAFDAGAKVGLMDQDNSQMCLLIHYRHRPTDASGGQARLSYARPLALGFSLGVNAGMGWTWANDVDEFMAEAEYTLALGYNVSESLYAYVEAFGVDGGLQGDAGLAWRPDPLSQFDVSVGWADGSGQSYVALGWSKLWMP